MASDDLIEAVMKEASACRLAAGRYDQIRMHEIARLLRENAQCAERWVAAPNDAARQRIRMSVYAPLTIRHALLTMEKISGDIGLQDDSAR